MKSNTKFLLVCSIILLFFGYFAILSMMSPKTTTGTVAMVQPCAWFWCSDYDANYAEVNVKNSEANKNNAEAHKLNAQATAIIGKEIREDVKVSAGNALLNVFFCILPGIVIGIIIIAIGIIRRQEY